MTDSQEKIEDWISTIDEGAWWKDQADGIIRDSHKVPTDCALRIMNLVEDSTRRGKMEAWAEARNIIENSVAIACGEEEGITAATGAVEFFKKVLAGRFNSKLRSLSQ